MEDGEGIERAAVLPFGEEEGHGNLVMGVPMVPVQEGESQVGPLKAASHRCVK